MPLESVGQWLVWPTLVGLLAKIAVNAVESVWLARYTQPPRNQHHTTLTELTRYTDTAQPTPHNPH